MKTIHNQNKKRILLVSLPFFTPITPPVGISVLKSYLESYHNDVFCMDFNVNDKLWGIHHNYFNLIKSANRLTDNIGYSTLWWILNAHLMAYTNTRDHDVCFKVVNEVLPKFYLSLDATTIYKLVELIERFFKILTDDINKEDYTNFGVVGVSTYSTSLASSLFFLQEVKKEYPNIKTIMGGGAFSDDLAIGSFNLKILENEYSSVDHVVVGEGELLLLANLEYKLPKKFILSKKDILDRQVDLNTIPLPDYTDFDLSYYSNLGIEGSRSCPYQCEFCSETIQWGKFRKKSSSLLCRQIEEMSIRYKKSAFFLCDSLINPYIEKLSKYLLKSQMNVSLDGYLRIDEKAARRENAEIWANAGLARVRLGVESASLDILNRMNKKTNPDMIAKVLENLAQLGIRTTIYWVVGFPGETEKDFQMTLDFIQENHAYIYESEVHPYMFYPQGQNISKKLSAENLYPESVENVIRFKLWDIRDGVPSRRERFERVHRLSEISNYYGLPNIYSLTDRYRAELRWQKMYPLAKDIHGDLDSNSIKDLNATEPMDFDFLQEEFRFS